MNSILYKVFVCLFYGLCSFGLSFINKWIFAFYDFKFPFILLLLQFVFNAGFSVTYGAFVDNGPKAIWKVPKLTLDGCKSCLIISCTFLSNVSFGVISLTKVSIPVFLAIRRMVTILIYIVDLTYLGKPWKILEFLGVVLITVGGILSAANDFYADYFGYFLVMMNNAATVLHFNLCKSLSQKKPELDAGAQTFYMSLLSIPVLLCLCLFAEDTNSYELFDRAKPFYISLFITTVMGCLLTFSQALCINVNSPIATSVTGNCKDILATIVGLLVFPDVLITPWLLIGLAASLSGAIIYSYSKLLDELQKSSKVK
ncbi:unnamed protein product [Blepharisma stoltei]|uniref:Sugar phosphate transporter domain-containing protein n=1 Tax=Blepharisma stoltei TaxID=1481888 RepID=A0AAU9JVN1_9CILI|nr:unnamed protein product [Blepharisma stoltei]